MVTFTEHTDISRKIQNRKRILKKMIIEYPDLLKGEMAAGNCKLRVICSLRR